MPASHIIWSIMGVAAFIVWGSMILRFLCLLRYDLDRALPYQFGGLAVVWTLFFIGCVAELLR